MTLTEKDLEKIRRIVSEEIRSAFRDVFEAIKRIADQQVEKEKTKSTHE
jgi:hypothetical protein